MVRTTINTLDHLDPSRPVTETAEVVAGAVLRGLDSGGSVTVSVRGVCGVPSSFFNVILKAVQQHVGGRVDPARLGFEFDSKLQEMIYQRSLDAVNAQAGRG